MSLTTAQREAYARAHVSTIHLWAIELRHSVFPAPIRIVQHTLDVDLDLEANAPADPGTTQTFTAVAFRFQEPELGTEPDSTVTLEIDGVGGLVQPYLSGANQTAEPIACTLRQFLLEVNAQTVTEQYAPIHLQIRGIHLDMTRVRLTAGYTNSANQDFPNALYTPETNPGLQ